jgi:hypothetical protein
MDYAEFWWNNITGPHELVMNVADSILENKIVVLNVPSDLPWRHEMRSSIEDVFKENCLCNEIVIQSIDYADDDTEQLKPGEFILKEFASGDIRRGYRERSSISIQEYINAKRVLKNRIIWVKGLNTEEAVEWISFCKGFKDTSAETGLYVLEIHGMSDVEDSSNLKYINFDEFIRPYDVRLFDNFVLDSETDLSDSWKEYVATLVSILCVTDAEVSVELINRCNFKRGSIEDCLKEIAGSSFFEKRGRQENSDHILSIIRNNDSDKIHHRIWTAQVQTLFPIIEMEKAELIEMFQDEISNGLKANVVKEYGERITSVKDVELGTMCYMMSRRDTTGNYYLYIPDEKMRNRIHFLHKCRNKLAHAECCDLSEVGDLLMREK